VVLEGPERLSLNELPLSAPTPEDVVVAVDWSGISTGTERLLWEGRMPAFPGMGYPLVPGYESVGRVVTAGESSGRRVGDHVFVPGAKCFGNVRGLFGGAASRLVLSGARTVPVPSQLGPQAVLLALAATAQHAIGTPLARLPDLIIGHGVLGRLIARLTLVHGGAAPVVWEVNAARRSGATGYEVIDPQSDSRRDYQSIYDVSGDPRLLDQLIARLGFGGEIVLAGFYGEPLSFSFAPAFMREARLRVAAEWKEADLVIASKLIAEERLSLDDLITHQAVAADAAVAYRTAFGDPSCLKMVLDWRNHG